MTHLARLSPASRAATATDQNLGGITTRAAARRPRRARRRRSGDRRGYGGRDRGLALPAATDPMTAAATIGALTPMALVFTAGLTTSTLLTLVPFPVLYNLTERASTAMRQRRGRRPATPAA